MKTFSYGLLPVLALTALPTAFAQDTPAQQPTVLEATFGKPQIKVLKDENKGPSRYEKWQERTLVILANVPSSTEGKSFTSSELKIPVFNLLIQSSQEEANFSKRWDALKAELSTITTATPKLVKWDISQYQSRNETTIPAQVLLPTPKAGYVYYTWVTRTIEMEGVHVDEDTMYKATLTVKVDKPTTKPIKSGRAFDTTTGEIVASPQKQ